MKKRLIFVILVLILLQNIFVYADDANINSAAKTVATTTTTTTNQFSGNLVDVGRGVDNATEDVLLKSVSIPSVIQTPIKIIFGITEGISWQQLIVLLGVWIMVFIFVISGVEFIPFINKKILKIILAIAITCLISLSGVMNSIVTFFLDIAGFLKITQEYSVLKVIVAVVIAVLLILITTGIMKKIKKKMIIDYAEVKGRQAGTGIEIGADITKEFREQQNNS